MYNEISTRIYIYRQVLHACPQLTHLQMSLGSNIQIPLTSNLISHKHLHHLDVRMFAVGEWWYDNIESLYYLWYLIWSI
jgi:hypothetical protein